MCFLKWFIWIFENFIWEHWAVSPGPLNERITRTKRQRRRNFRKRGRDASAFFGVGRGGREMSRASLVVRLHAREIFLVLTMWRFSRSDCKKKESLQQAVKPILSCSLEQTPFLSTSYHALWKNVTPRTISLFVNLVPKYLKAYRYHDRGNCARGKNGISKIIQRHGSRGTGVQIYRVFGEMVPIL